MEPPFNKAGISNWTKLKQNSIKPNQTPIIWVDSVIKPSWTSIFPWVQYLSNQLNQMNKIEICNRIQSDLILFGIHFLISKSCRSNHNQPLLNGINRKTSKHQTKCQYSVAHVHMNKRTKRQPQIEMHYCLHFLWWEGNSSCCECHHNTQTEDAPFH